MKNSVVVTFVGFIVAFMLSACGGSPTGVSNMTPIPYDGAESISEAKIKTYLDAINDARSASRDCGRYKVDSNGDIVKDSDGNYIKIYDENDTVPSVDSLSWSNSLYLAAYEHSADLAAWNHDITDESTARTHVSHDGSNTDTDWTSKKQNLGRASTVVERTKNNGYVADTGENITAGTDIDTAVETVDSWLHSPPHCKNIMSAAYKNVGMAQVTDSDSFYINYWTQNLGI